MPINTGAFNATPFKQGSINVPFIPGNGPPHAKYDWQQILCTSSTAAGYNGNLQINFAAAALGVADTMFLPYGLGEIHSVYIPAPHYSPGNAPPAYFATSGMSGCKLFIDTVTTGIIVHHANAGFGAAYGLGGAAPNVENVALNTALDTLHTTALAYYTGAPHNLVVMGPNRSLGRATYSTCQVAEENRKINQGRQNVAFMGGTTVVGVRTNGHWEFFWQTAGGCTYDRPPANIVRRNMPGYAPSVTVHSLRYKVLGHGRFYP